MRAAALAGAFLNQDWGAVQHMVDTNVIGTTHLLLQVGRRMRARKAGRILIAGSIGGFTLGSFQAIYNASNAYLNSFVLALREELSDTGVSVILLEPGATETAFFRRADMLDTTIGWAKKDDLGMVVKARFKSIMAGSSDVASGWKNKLLSALANVTLNEVLAKAHGRMAGSRIG